MNTLIIGSAVAIVLIVAIWFGFVAPSERRYHERKLELMRERIERRRQVIEDRADAADAD